MEILKAYLGNLLKIGLVVVGMLIFAKIFYPEAFGIFPLIGQVYTGLNLWPVMILGLLLVALPWRRKRRRR